jgi:hypothetical protein
MGSMDSSGRADCSNRMRRERHRPGYPGRTEPRIELQQRQCPQNHSHLLDAAAQHLPQFLLILIVQVKRLGWARHTQV